MSYPFDYGWRRYVPVATRRHEARRQMEKLRKKGHPVSPVVIEGRTIARTFWGKAWCDNLERYSDFSNRLPRGRTYVRNGSVVDLQIARGQARALVSGSDLYAVEVGIAAVPRARWASICSDCAGAVDSLVELLQGRFSKGVMERICRPKTGLFPAPAEIELSCSCPDWASMCKHVAAVLYGVGARLDERPELLFELRKVDGKDLVSKAGRQLPLSKKRPARDRVLAAGDLSELFGLEMGTSSGGSRPRVSPAPIEARAKRVAKPRPGARKASAGNGKRARKAKAKHKSRGERSASAAPGIAPARARRARARGSRPGDRSPAPPPASSRTGWWAPRS
jgi:uncharacterized Zn finger protein